MRRLVYFLILAQQTYFVLASLWPITLALIAVWLSAVLLTRTESPGKRWRLFGLSCLPLFVVPVAILLCGMVFVHEPPADEDATASTYPLYLIWGLLVSLLPLAAAMVWRWPARWPTVVASAILAGYTSLCSAFICGMSVSGVWL